MLVNPIFIYNMYIWHLARTTAKLTMITLNGLQFQEYISEATLLKAIDEVAAQINSDFKGKEPVFLVVLNGAYKFATELLSRFEGDCEIEFIKMSSYDGTSSTGQVQTHIPLEADLEEREVVIVEDIVDSGNTIEKITQMMVQAGVNKYRIASLFYKPEAYTKEYKIHYVGLEIPNDFIVGYGLDYNGLGRNLNAIYKLKTTKMTNLVLFGPPGAGKGTQASFLKEKYNLVHISTGDVFRYNIKNATELGTLAKSYIDKGQLVPDSVTIDMLSATVDETPDANGFIFDGFPRTTAQAEALDKLLAEKGTEVSAMIALEVDDEILVKRLLERGKTSGRKDDADETVIRNRIKVYYDETAILKGYYQKQDKYFGVDGVGEINEITTRLSSVIDKL
ncbi:adenylate kinase [Leeuwenhoekiella blandensis MED217]|uniref:Adenylate kinase n=2 Tax=Flavobacteriaceae TaxID=49546 RepID=A3XQY1_LEEBM|nr:adenylate kinase [Leeuwenhoekiella blandensis MED217]